MPALTFEEINQHCDYVPDIFVETGTYEGETVDNIRNHFKKVYTIELDPRLAQQATQKYASDPHVRVIFGDSGNELPKLCKNIDQTTFFWLDGHFSGGKTAKGLKDCPVLEECQAIAENCKEACIVTIDDTRLFGTKTSEDYSDITLDKIQSIFKDRAKKISFFDSSKAMNDRLVIHLQPLMETLYAD